MTTDTEAPPVTKLIPLAAIAAPLFNSRDYEAVNPQVVEDGEVIKDDSLTALGNSLLKDGQKQPIGVRLIVDDGDASKYRLIWGSRRKLAAESIKWTHIEAKVYPLSKDADNDDVVANAVENFARKDLSTYEKARTFAELRRRKVKLETIAASSGFSFGYVGKLATCFVKLHPDIVAAWKGGSMYADVPFLFELTKEAQKDQLPMWEAHIAAADTGDEDGGDTDDKDNAKKGPKADPVKVIRVPLNRYTRVVRAMSAKKTPAAAVEIVKYLAGKTRVCASLGINDETEK